MVFGHFKNDSKNNFVVFKDYPVTFFNNVKTPSSILFHDTIPLTDSLQNIKIDTLGTDSLNLNNITSDSLGIDSLNFIVSDNAIDATINYTADDSTIMDAINQVVHLYGSAYVKYGDMELKAAYISFSFKDNVAEAFGKLDSTGTLMNKPEFSDKGDIVTQDYLKYNFVTKTGISKKAISSQSGAFLHAETSKIQPNLWVHINDGKFTTCDAENPHYHFHLNKAIVIPNDKIVSGPVYLKVRKVPLPLALPFGFFPNKKESSHGIIIPGYGFSPNLGFFLKNGGYFYPINDRLNTKLLFDGYSRGSWKVQSINQYRTRYKYSGSFKISKTTTKRGLKELEGTNLFSIQNDFKVDWNHHQDSKARPGINFSADVHFGTSTNNRSTISTNIEEITSASYNSSVQWSKSWSDKPINLSLSARHAQNLRDSSVTVTLPSITLSWNPNLAALNNTGIKKGYENIRISYSSSFENRLSGKDRDFGLNNLHNLNDHTSNGARHVVKINKSIKFAKGLISFNPSATWTEFWAFRSTEKIRDFSNDITVIDTIGGFIRAGDFDASFSTDTRLYQMFNINGKNIKAVRHVMSPSLGLSWSPKADRTKVFYTDTLGKDQSYNPWNSNIYQASNRNESLSMNYGIGNNLEMKVRDRKALKPTSKKIKLIESFRVSSSYNFIADSLKMRNISFTGFTTIAKKVSVNYNSSYSPYARDTNGNSVDTYLLSANKKLLRLRDENLTFGMNFKSKAPKKKEDKVDDTEFSEVDNTDLEEINRNKNNYIDWSVPWSLNVSYTLALNKSFDQTTKLDTNVVTSSIGTRGDFTVFEKWKVGFNINYDVVNKDFTSSTIDLFWDLHCWEFTAHYSPWGFNKYFNVQLNIKSSLLKDLKLQRRFPIYDEDRLQ